MTDAERELLLTVAKALAIEGRLGRRLIDAVERESEQHTEALARRTLYFDTAANALLRGVPGDVRWRCSVPEPCFSARPSGVVDGADHDEVSDGQRACTTPAWYSMLISSPAEIGRPHVPHRATA